MKLRRRTGQEMAAWQAILRRHGPYLARRTGVVRVDFGYRWCMGRMRDAIALRVHVEPDLSAAERRRLPRVLGAIPVDVLEARFDLDAAAETLGGGLETGNVFRATAGTLGAIVFDRRTGAPMALSCHHVYVGQRPNGGVGDPVAQPAVGTSAPELHIGRVERSDAALDCAVARLESSRPFVACLKGAVEPCLGMQVTKIGCRTGATSGIVDGCDATSFTVVALPGSRRRVLAVRGDSGAVWFESDSHAAAGLHVAAARSGRVHRYRATRMSAVAERLGIQAARTSVVRADLVEPALAAFAGTLFLVGCAPERLLRGGASAASRPRIEVRRSADGRHFTKPLRLLGAASGAAAAAFGGRLCIAWTGCDGAVRVAWSKDGRSFTNARATPARSDRAPALAVHGDHVVLAWRDARTRRLRLARSRDAVEWTPLPAPDARTASAPALAVFAGQLHLAYVEVRTKRLRLSRWDGRWRRIALPRIQPTSRPALVPLEGGGILAWAGDDGRVQLWRAGRGGVWRQALVLQPGGRGAPGLVALGSDLVCCWPVAAEKLHLLRFPCRSIADLRLV